MEKNVNFKELYFELFNGISDIIAQLEKLQQDAEEKYISSAKGKV